MEHYELPENAMPDESRNVPFASIAARAIRVAEAAVQAVTDNTFVPTENNLQLTSIEQSGRPEIGVMIALPASLAPTQERAREIADQARDFILNHSEALRERNGDSLPGLVSKAEAVDGGYKASFHITGTVQELAAALVPLSNIVMERSDRPR